LRAACVDRSCLVQDQNTRLAFTVPG
jgi:hypothetical protein